MKIVIGLGNPGEKYEGTRHNVGFMAVDTLAKELKCEDWKEEKKFKAFITEASLTSKTNQSTNADSSSKTNTSLPQSSPQTVEKVLLVKPLTFMNLSGESAAALLNFYKVSPADIIAIYDDIDLPFGQIRVRQGGGPGTHNGMKSLVTSLGTQEFPRVRIGIESRGVHAPEHQDLHSFVLSKFTPPEEEELSPILMQAISETLTMLTT